MYPMTLESQYVSISSIKGVNIYTRTRRGNDYGKACQTKNINGKGRFVTFTPDLYIYTLPLQKMTWSCIAWRASRP